jgi:hypothetical protein
MPSSRTVLAVSALAALVSSGAAFTPASSLPLRSAQRAPTCTQLRMSEGGETVRLTRGKCLNEQVHHLPLRFLPVRILCAATCDAFAFAFASVLERCEFNEQDAPN